VTPEVPNRHDPRIEELADAASATNPTNAGFNSAPGALSNSWNRCLVDYHVDPQSGTAPNVVTQTELKASKEPVRDVIEQAREEIDRLYAIVRQQEYVVLLCNKDGVAIHHRGDETRPTISNIGEFGSGAFGLKKLRAQMASGLASPNNGQCWSIADNTTVLAITN